MRTRRTLNGSRYSRTSRMKLAKKQREILIADERRKPKILILEGAVRSGKTFLNNALFYKEIRRRTGAGKHWIITGHSLGSIKRNVLEPMSEEFGLTIKMDPFGTFDLYGNKVHCFGADKADSYKSMTGMTAAGWYGNEVTLQHENSIQEAFNRCSDPEARIIWDTNPDYPEHPIKRNFIDQSGERLSNGRLRIQSFHFQLDDNPFLSPEYIENLRRSTPAGMWYDRRIKGLWVSAEGLVYEDWNPEVHVVEPFEIPDDWQRVRSIDLGYNNPFVCLWGAIDHDGRLYIYDEHYADHQLIKWHAERIKQRPGAFAWTVRDHDAQEGAELEDNGVSTWPAQKDVDAGIQKVALRLRVQEDGKPRLFVSRLCENTRRELGMYRWQEKRSDKPLKEQPMKVKDHTCFVAGTMIATSRGSKPIETIHVGDLILTRRGWRKASAAGMTEASARIVTVKIGTSYISGTPNHKIYVNGKWLSLDTLRYMNRIEVCKLKPSYSTESNSDVIPSHSTAPVKTTLLQGLQTSSMELGDFTKRYGKPLMARSHLGMRCIILMAIRLITQLTTWIASRFANIENGMASIIKRLKHALPTWPLFGHWLLSGIDQRLALNGIGSTRTKYGRTGSRIIEYVMNVDGNMKRVHGMDTSVSAPMHARREAASNLALTLNHENVRAAEANSVPTNIPQHAIVQENVHGWHVKSEREPVYNLTVEDTHEFFANGVLVRNCDALRYMVMELDAGGILYA